MRETGDCCFRMANCLIYSSKGQTCPGDLGRDGQNRPDDIRPDGPHRPNTTFFYFKWIFTSLTNEKDGCCTKIIFHYFIKIKSITNTGSDD